MWSSTFKVHCVNNIFYVLVPTFPEKGHNCIYWAVSLSIIKSNCTISVINITTIYRLETLTLTSQIYGGKKLCCHLKIKFSNSDFKY